MATTDRLSLTQLAEGQRDKTTTINGNNTILDGAAYKIQGIYPFAGSPTTIPAAADNQNALIIITGVDGSPLVDYLCYSDGTNWRKIAQVIDTIVV